MSFKVEEKLLKSVNAKTNFMGDENVDVKYEIFESNNHAFKKFMVLSTYLGGRFVRERWFITLEEADAWFYSEIKKDEESKW